MVAKFVLADKDKNDPDTLSACHPLSELDTAEKRLKKLIGRLLAKTIGFQNEAVHN